MVFIFVSPAAAAAAPPLKRPLLLQVLPRERALARHNARLQKCYTFRCKSVTLFGAKVFTLFGAKVLLFSVGERWGGAAFAVAA